jgi:UDP-N-acetylmuramate: L-alanyl-gamma-D-glutamyl-meso-diaminopimelate ligase
LTLSPQPLHIHIVAIGGTGTAPLAALLAADGHRVTGSDAALYPPMSTLLAEAGIAPRVGFEPAHLEPRPDLVIVGNAVPRSNPEAVECERLGLPRLSMPEALARFYLADRQPLVVAGTHGKTTTSALAAWVWTCCGGDPGYLVGGVPLELGASFRRGGGARFVVEGDEYNAAYFDRGAKFLHYRPETAIITSVEHDHVDLYPTAESFREAFRRLVALVPERGAIVACGDDDELRGIVAGAAAEVELYGERADNPWCIVRPPAADPAGARFTIREPDGTVRELALGVWGAHNAANALAVWIAARRDGLDPERVAAAFAAFRGVLRRQELLGEPGGIAVVDDFAHHPTAVAKTLDALRQRFPGRRLIALFEPRSLTAGRAFLVDGYRDAFARADRVVLAPIFHRARLSDDQRLDVDRLAAELGAGGTPTVAAASLEAIEALVIGEARAGDVVVTMSSGSFGNLARRLVAAFGAASSASSGASRVG